MPKYLLKKKISIYMAFMLALIPIKTIYAKESCLSPQKSTDHVLSCYVKGVRASYLDYRLDSLFKTDGIIIKEYTLNALNWDAAKPENWQHKVALYIPTHSYHPTALVVINNGNNSGKAYTADANESDLQDIAKQTNTVVVSIHTVPNQPLTLTNENKPLTEDALVAQSWMKSMTSPQLPIQFPMAASTIRAMDLAQKELQKNSIKNFIVTGASKRGWAAWLAALADTRIKAIVPAAIDIVDFKSFLQETNKIYANQWPIAFYDYYKAGVTKQLDRPEFATLMQMIDPFAYNNTSLKQRLAIDKYILSNSGDDFFVPDALGHALEILPGNNHVRVAPNSDHAGIRNIMKDSLIQYLNRTQRHIPLPTLNAHYSAGSTTLYFNEHPVELTQWRAVNPQTRDFRKACGIRYEPTKIKLTVQKKVDLKTPPTTQGWSATFYEAKYADGFTVTTPVHVAPQHVYPDVVSPAQGGCRTLP